jgi:riboflavin kinase
VKISSSELADLIVTSSKTAARHLQALEKNNLIERQTTTSGQWIMLTPEGIKRLEEEYRFYQQLFKTRTPKQMTGSIITGMGEGQYYISNEGYKKQIEEKLGFTPFPGTLNVKLDRESVLTRRSLDAKKGIEIEGFTSDNRTFGGGVCFPVKIGGIKGAIIQPDRTHYPPEIIEIIAPVNLREKLKLKDGSTIKIHLE